MAAHGADAFWGGGMFRRLEMQDGAAQQVGELEDHDGFVAAELAWQEDRLSRTRLVIDGGGQVAKECAGTALPQGGAVGEILGVQDRGSRAGGVPAR